MSDKTAELVADTWTRERARYIVSVSGHGNTPARLYHDEAVNREPIHVGTIDDCDRIVDLGCARAVLAALSEAARQALRSEGEVLSRQDLQKCESAVSRLRLMDMDQTADAVAGAARIADSMALERYLSRLKSERQVEGSDDKWLPIESASLDGTYVDVWDGTSRRTNCSYRNGGWVQYTGKDRGVTRFVSGFIPTHWRHRPGPPGAGDHT